MGDITADAHSGDSAGQEHDEHSEGAVESGYDGDLVHDD